MSERCSFSVSLDRIEEGMAVLITSNGHQFLLPRELLPDSSREGDVIDIVLERNPEKTLELAESVRDLHRRLLERTARRHEDSGPDDR